MSLTSKEIKFIDAYLKNQGVEYFDVRVEMLDHVATILEAEINKNGASFYEAFKNYMIVHKKELLTNNRKFIRSVDFNLLKRVVSNVCTLQSLLVFIMSCIVVNLLLSNLNSFKAINMILPTISISGGFLYFIFLLKNKKEFNFSAINRLGLFFVLISQIGTSFGKYFFAINSLQELSGSKFYMLLFSSALLFTAYYLMIRTGIQYKREYQDRFIQV